MRHFFITSRYASSVPTRFSKNLTTLNLMIGDLPPVAFAIVSAHLNSQKFVTSLINQNLQ